MSNQPAHKNDINALRATLFETLQGLKDGKLDVERAKAICDASQTIINSVKVEIDFTKTTGLQTNSEFIPTLPQPKHVPMPALQNLRDKGLVPSETSRPGISHPAPGHTVHRMRG